MYSLIKDLPNVVQSALKSLSYHKKDIRTELVEEISPQIAGGNGTRGILVLVDMSSETYENHHGSWGGSNMFNQQNPVDLDSGKYPIPINGAVIKASEGNGILATLYLNPKAILPILSVTVEFSSEEKKAMYAYGCLKSGPYRQEALKNVKLSTIEDLIKKGYLKKDGRGISITTAGKNTRKYGLVGSDW